jgi:hypothetical protein
MTHPGQFRDECGRLLGQLRTREPFDRAREGRDVPANA